MALRLCALRLVYPMQGPKPVEETLYQWARSRTVKLISAKAINLIPCKPQFAVGGNHLSIGRKRWLPVVTEMLRTIHFNDDTLAVGQ